MKKGYLAGILFGMASVLAISAYSLLAFLELLDSYDTRRILFLQQADFLKLFSTLKDAELGQKGYLIAQSDDYLEPYYTAVRSLDDYMLNTREAARSYNQTPLFNELERMIRISLEIMSQNILQVKLGKSDLGSESLNQEAGKRVMDNIRTIINQLTLSAENSLTQQQNEINLLGKRTTWGIGLSIFFINLLIGLYSYLFYRDSKKIEKISKELDQTSHVYQIVFENAEQGIVRTDNQGNIQGINKKAGILLNSTSDEVVNQNILNYYDLKYLKNKLNGFNKEEFLSFNSFISSIRAVVSSPIEAVMKEKGGKTFPSTQIVTPLKNKEDQVVGHLFLISDLSENKQWKRSIQIAKEAMEAAYLSRNQFIASLGHDFKPPLAAIAKNAALLGKNKSPYLDIQDRNAISEIGSKARRLLELTTRIVDTNKNLNGQLFESEKKPINLHEFLHSVIREFELKRGEGLKVQAEIPFDIKSLSIDPEKLKDILFHMLQASAFHSSDGVIVLRVKDDPFSYVPQEISIGPINLNKEGERKELPLEAIQGAAGINLSLSHSLAKILGYQVKIYSIQSKMLFSLQLHA